MQSHVGINVGLSEVWSCRTLFVSGRLNSEDDETQNESETFFEIATFALGKEQSTMASCKVLWASAYDSATIRCCALSFTLCDSKQPRRKQKHKTFIAGTSRHALMQL